jgi:hypothetical protein
MLRVIFGSQKGKRKEQLEENILMDNFEKQKIFLFCCEIRWKVAIYVSRLLYAA